MPDDRRSLILAAAERLFHHYGPLKTTVADIAREAQVGVGTVYLEFPSKDAILLSLSTSGYQQVLDAMTAAWDEPGTAAERLTRVLDARLEQFLSWCDRSLHGADLLHCRGCDPVLLAYKAFKRQERALIVRFVEDGFSSSEPKRTADALLTAYRAFAPPLVFGQRPEALRAAIAGVHELVFEGPLSRPVSPG